MMLHIPAVLDPQQVRTLRQKLDQASWIDGLSTSGEQASKCKRNLQLAPDTPLAQQLGQQILSALGSNPLFISAALPARILPPYFNRYENGGTFGNHVDNAIRIDPISGQRLRTDVSSTLFLSDPDEYVGGELIVDDTYGTHSVKLPAGDMIVYPSTSLHRVEPVTSGARVCAFFWTQSMIRDDARRQMLFDLDVNIQNLRQHIGDTAETVSLTSHYHNLLRLWAEL